MAISEVFSVVLAAISGIVGVWGAIQKAKAGKAEAAVDDSIAALHAFIAAMELLPAKDPRVVQAKNLVRQIGDVTGAEKDTIKKTVKEVRAILGNAGFVPEKDETSSSQVERAASAILAARKIRAASQKSGVPMAVKAGVLLLLLLPFIGCVKVKTPIPLTVERVWPSTILGAPDDLTVEWPRGVKAEEVITVDSTSYDGETRAISVAPLPALGEKK